MSHLSSELGAVGRKQELIDHYENLRTLALEKSKISSTSSIPGFSVLIYRGMVSWMRICLSSEPIAKSKVSLFEITNNIDQASQAIPVSTLPHMIHKEAANILTNMILFQQENLRNHYA